MFKMNLFYPIEYRRRIRNYMTLKMKVKVIWNQWHLKTIEWAISDSLWICESNRRSICNFTRSWLYLPLPICINCRTLAWEGVYVYKLAFFFWLSPITYHFLFKKRLIIDWRYFWRNMALSLILERSPDYPLNKRLPCTCTSLMYTVYVHSHIWCSSFCVAHSKNYIFLPIHSNKQIQKIVVPRWATNLTLK